MGLFRRKKKKDAPEVKVQAESPKTTKLPARMPEPEAPAAAKPAVKPTPVKKATLPSTPAPKPAAKATAAKAPVKPAAKPTAKPGITGAPLSRAGRPFFMTTEEDIRIAFDQAIAKADAEILKSDSKAVGKYEFNLEVDGFHFYLIANNGQILFESPSFTTLLGALSGLDTFKRTVAKEPFVIRVDKYKRYRFILARKYYGENYTTREQCVKCVESVKNFASCAKILYYKPSAEAVRAFEAAKNAKRTPEDIDWRAVEKAEAEAPRMGKFEISFEGDEHYCFYLLANNGQILYSSRYYASEKACRAGIDSFKRAAYVGNFFVDRDKFGNYRYVLKNIGSAPSFIGESYDNKPQCEKIIDSVKKFIVTATIELEVKAII